MGARRFTFPARRKSHGYIAYIDYKCRRMAPGAWPHGAGIDPKPNDYIDYIDYTGAWRTT